MSTSKKLRSKLKKGRVANIPNGDMQDWIDLNKFEEWIEEGMDSVYAAYAIVQNLTSIFSEGVSQLPEMKKFVNFIVKAEDEYQPSAPPISPLTTSFFTTWAFYDLRFDGTDTLASCLIDSHDLVGMTSDQFDALKKLSVSRMGIYEQIGMEGSHVRLRELITDAEYICYIASGYCRCLGELWYVRLLPPLLPDLGNYSIAFTTPYILKFGKNDWLRFLERGLSQLGFGVDKNGLHTFLKYGPDPNYWNEFVFSSYHDHEGDAIFLTGIPDMKATLPHS